MGNGAVKDNNDNIKELFLGAHLETNAEHCRMVSAASPWNSIKYFTKYCSYLWLYCTDNAAIHALRALDFVCLGYGEEEDKCPRSSSREGIAGGAKCCAFAHNW